MTKQIPKTKVKLSDRIYIKVGEHLTESYWLDKIVRKIGGGIETPQREQKRVILVKKKTPTTKATWLVKKKC